MIGDVLSIYLSKNETNVTFSILEDRIYPGGGPPPHIQTRESERFYILEGELDFNIDEQTDNSSSMGLWHYAHQYLLA